MCTDPVDWDGYTVYEESFRLEASAEQSRKDARAEFDQLMEGKPARTEELQAVLNRNGGPTLAFTNESLAALNDWLIEAIGSEGERLWDSDNDALWRSLAFDIGLYLGDFIIERFPGLRWQLMISGSKKAILYQRIVIGGWKNELRAVDYRSLVNTYRKQVAADDDYDPRYLLTLVDHAATKV